MRRSRSTALALSAGAAALALVAAACSSSGSTSSSKGVASGRHGGAGSSLTGTGLQISSINNSGTPVKGGTLTVLGTSDVDDALDPNIGYYTLDYVTGDLISRSLYTYPSIPGKTFSLAPDLATALPTVSDGGLEYSVTIRTGAMWDTTPPRQVDAADVVRGLKRSCNPTDPFGGQPDFSDILVGYTQFCAGFDKVSATSASAQAAFIDKNGISGVTVDSSNPLTVVFRLNRPANYFAGVLNLPPFNPAPAEILGALPDSNNLWRTDPADGPYQVKSYVPDKSIALVRNPAWNPASDPIRKAYVNAIDVNETGTQQGIYQQILTNSPAADVQWDIPVPSTAVPGLIADHDARLSLQTEGSTNPFIIFNTISKNNGGALGNVLVRRAISYALDRTELIQNHGGPDIDPPLTHLVSPGTDGSSPAFDDYPYNLSKAEALLKEAGVGHMTLKLLYRPANITAVKDFETIQANLAAIGITVTGVPASEADFYGKYLIPGTAAKNSVWDLAEGGWGPDWYPTGGKSYFLPILDGLDLPPQSSNFGFFDDPKLNTLMQKALAAPDNAAAAPDWHAADLEAMAQAAVYPVADPNGAYIHGSQVHNFVFIGPLQDPDYANLWLS